MFHQLLNWLDEGENSNGEKYLEMHRRLVSYFRRKGCASPDDLADETLNRVARRLQEEGSLNSTTPVRYCYIVARFVFLEHFRAPARNPMDVEELSGSALSSAAAVDSVLGKASEHERKEKMLECLEHCLKNLGAEDRKLIFDYYQGEQRIKIENRRALAAFLGLSPNALSIRACRIRNKLEVCVRQSLKGVKGFEDFTLSIGDRPNGE